MTIAIISHLDCLKHVADWDHPERPDRVSAIQQALQSYAFKTKPVFYDAPLADAEQLKLAHDSDYVDEIFSLDPGESVIPLDEDTYFNQFSLIAARRAAGAVIEAVDLVERKQATVVFCNVRPPGHHAEPHRAMGFCIFNNVAVGARYALKQYQLSRIAIIDFDVHHGNGTQAIFQDDPRILYCSSFQHPFYPGYDERNDRSHLLPIPLPAHTNSQQFRQLIETHWLDQIEQFAPQLIFISAGFDAHQDDPLANVNLSRDDYVWLSQAIKTIAVKCCDGKIISVLEGGYDLNVLKTCVPAHVEALV